MELAPETPWGVLFGLSEKAPPARADSAARESDVTAPVPKTSILVLAIFSRVFRSGLECLESSEVYFR